MPNIQTQGMQMPVANKAAADQVRATNDIALQQQMKSAGANTPVTTADIQNLGTQQAQQQTAVNQAEQAGGLANTINTAQRDFQSQQNALAQQGIMDDQARAQARIDAEEQLASLGADVRETLLDRELALDENTNQLRFTNERQLADLATKLAGDERALTARLRHMEHTSQRRVQAAQYAVDAFTQAQEFIAKDRQLAADVELRRMVAEKKREAERKEQEARKKAGQTKKMIGAVKAVAGAVMIATGVGAGAGAVLATSGAQDIAEES